MIEQILPPDIPRVLTGVAEWSAALMYVLIASGGARRVRIVAVAAVALVVQVGIQLAAGTLPLALWTAGMAIAVAAMFVFIARAALTPMRMTGYLTARALVLAELVASFHWQLHVFFFESGTVTWDFGRVAFAVVVYGASFALAAWVEARSFPPADRTDVTGRELFLSSAIALVTFGMSNMSFLSADTPFSGRLGAEVLYIRTLVDFGGFVALNAQQRLRLETHTRAELAAIDAVLRSQHDQYLQSKRSIDAVQSTYHDLKHQIAVIRAEENPERKRSHLDELEASLQGYAAISRTGNGVLDVILTTKQAICLERGIRLTCVADGALIEFMSVMDICTVFGNALDNAIEAASLVTDPERRLIRMAVYAQEDLVLVAVENYFGGRLRFENGQIVTTKADRDRHGYGLKSIRRTAEAYGGSMTVRGEDGWFRLRILLPASAEARQVDDPAPRAILSPRRGG